MEVTEESGAFHEPPAYGRRSYGRCSYRALAPGGCGWGDPLERPAAMVQRDVRDGLVSPQAARETYGVALDSRLAVDAEATAQLRAAAR